MAVLLIAVILLAFIVSFGMYQMGKLQGKSEAHAEHAKQDDDPLVLWSKLMERSHEDWDLNPSRAIAAKDAAEDLIEYLDARAAKLHPGEFYSKTVEKRYE